MDKKSMSKGITLGNVIGGFVVVLVGVILSPIIATQVTESLGNFSGASANIFSLITLFFVLGVMILAITLMTRAK